MITCGRCLLGSGLSELFTRQGERERKKLRELLLSEMGDGKGRRGGHLRDR
jgi:hypothetical protein